MPQTGRKTIRNLSPLSWFDFLSKQSLRQGLGHKTVPGLAPRGNEQSETKWEREPMKGVSRILPSATLRDHVEHASVAGN